MLHTIYIKKEKLTTKLTENREKHIEEYDQAVKDYKVIAKYAMEQMAKNAQSIDVLKECGTGILSYLYSLRPETENTWK